MKDLKIILEDRPGTLARARGGYPICNSTGNVGCDSYLHGFSEIS